MRLILKTSLFAIPRLTPTFFPHTPTVILPLHSLRPAKTLRTITPSFHISTRAPMSTHQVRDTIDLTAIEKNIFDRLLATLSHFQLQTQLRVAGGWVRDKVCTHTPSPKLLLFAASIFVLLNWLVAVCLCVQLLGKDCYDIDIALDNMMGTEFVDKVREYLLTIGEDAQGVCVIERYLSLIQLCNIVVYSFFCCNLSNWSILLVLAKYIIESRYFMFWYA